MNLATRIQHHSSRAALLHELLHRLEGLPSVGVVTDPGGRQRSTWRSHRLCLESCPDDATHLLVLQDDAWPCERFAEAVTAAIAEKPDSIISLFVSGIGHLSRQVNLHRKRSERWFIMPRMPYVPVVGIVYPTEVSRQIPAFADAKRISVGRSDDAVIAQFVQAHQLHPLAILPSLVEHLDHVPSVMAMPYGNGASHRLAAWFENVPHLTTA